MKYSFRIDVALMNFGAKIMFFTKRDKDILGNAEKSSALISWSGLVVETFCKTPLRTVAINENCFCCVWFDVIYNKVYIRHKLKTQGKQIQRNVPCDKSYTKITGKTNGFFVTYWIWVIYIYIFASKYFITSKLRLLFSTRSKAAFDCFTVLHCLV